MFQKSMLVVLEGMIERQSPPKEITNGGGGSGPRWRDPQISLGSEMLGHEHLPSPDRSPAAPLGMPKKPTTKVQLLRKRYEGRTNRPKALSSADRAWRTNTLPWLIGIPA